MAKKGQGSRPRTGAKIPMTGEEKSARDALVRSQQLAQEATSSRVSTVTRGAFAARRLRSGGTELQRYAIGGYADDPFPKPGGYTGGGASPSAPTSGSGGRRTSKPKKSSGGSKTKPRRDVRKTGEGGNQRYSPRSPGTQGSKVVNTRAEKQRRAEILAAERAKAEAAKRKRAEAARRKKANQKQTKVTTGGRVMS